MAARNGQELVQAWVPADVAQAFRAQARRTEGGTSAALRRLLVEATGEVPAPVTAAVGAGLQVGVRFKAAERKLLAEAAGQHGTSPANWLRALALVHLARRPQWNPAELEALRDVFRELRRIGTNVNQAARALNGAVQTGDVRREQVTAVVEAAEAVRIEMRRVVALLTTNFDYWGLPQDDVPKPSAVAARRAEEAAREAEAKRRARPRRRPAPFAAS